MIETPSPLQRMIPLPSRDDAGWLANLTMACMDEDAPRDQAERIAGRFMGFLTARESTPSSDVVSNAVYTGGFFNELSSLINRYSKENDSDTPDFILARYIEGCMQNYADTVKARDKWFNYDPWQKNSD